MINPRDKRFRLYDQVDDVEVRLGTTGVLALPVNLLIIDILFLPWVVSPFSALVGAVSGTPSSIA
jgi:hypothetical protein